MKKLLGIVVLGLILSQNTFAGWFDKKIKVSKCYDPKKYNSYKHLVKEEGPLDWNWEIDLEKGTAILSFISSGKLNIIKHNIKIQTDRYIIASDNKTPDVQFDLKNEVYISEHSPNIAEALGYKDVMLQCKFN